MIWYESIIYYGANVWVPGPTNRSVGSHPSKTILLSWFLVSLHFWSPWTASGWSPQRVTLANGTTGPAATGIKRWNVGQGSDRLGQSDHIYQPIGISTRRRETSGNHVCNSSQHRIFSTTQIHVLQYKYMFCIWIFWNLPPNQKQLKTIPSRFGASHPGGHGCDRGTLEPLHQAPNYIHGIAGICKSCQIFYL